MPSAAQAARVIERYRGDPVAYVHEVLGKRTWSKQRMVLRSLAEPYARVAVRSAHATGKTACASWAVLWWVSTGGVAVTTATTWRQVKEQLWREVRRAYLPVAAAIEGVLTETKFEITPRSFAIGISSNDEVAFQGIHGERVLVIADEATGVKPGIFNAIEGIRAGGDVRVLMQGNPWGNSGPFYAAFGVGRTGWTKIHISAFDTPNLHGLTPDALRAMSEKEIAHAYRPYLVSRRFVREKLSEWGEGTPLWESKILGNFPALDERALIPLAWCEAARVREVEPKDADPWEAGVDVADGGDDETVVAVRHGGKVEVMRGFRGDARGDVLAMLKDAAAPWAGRLGGVKVDKIGVGAYFAHALSDAGLDVADVNVALPASDKERFVNLRAEYYWGLRERFESGEVSLPDDDTLVAQLSSVRYFHKGTTGQTQIESKEDARKRGVKSPDRADALMLAFAPAGGLVIGICG